MLKMANGQMSTPPCQPYLLSAQQQKYIIFPVSFVPEGLASGVRASIPIRVSPLIFRTQQNLVPMYGTSRPPPGLFAFCCSLF